MAEWTPCAIGALPCAFDPNGRQPSFNGVHTSTLSPESLAKTVNAQPSAMAFAVQSSKPSGGAQSQKSNEQQAALDVVAEVSTSLGVVSEMESVDASSQDDVPLYSDYWQRFTECAQEADNAKPKSTVSLIPCRKAVRVL